MRQVLSAYGVVISAVLIVMIILPYLRGRSELLTTWNLFLLGSLNFVGISTIQAGAYWELSDPGRFFRLDDADIWIFMAVCTVFYLTLSLTYNSSFYLVLKRAAITEWPQPTGGTLYLLAIVLSVIGALGTVFLIPLPFVGQVLSISGPAAAALGFGMCLFFAFCYPKNPFAWGIAILSILFAMYANLVWGTGRRPLLSVAMTVPILGYWIWGRYWSARRVVPVLLASVVVITGLIGAYTAVRHRYNSIENTQGNVAGENLSLIAENLLKPESYLRNDFIGSDASFVSLAAIHLSRKEGDGQWLRSALFVLSNPIPRTFWPNKPEALGLTLPRMLGQWNYGYVNWGPGIVGHCWHDGGFAAAILYGLLFGIFIRWLDEWLITQPGNPFVAILLGSFAGHWVAMPRGDIGVFAIAIAGSFVAFYPVMLAARSVSFQHVHYPVMARRADAS